jgi:hypothetical protein
MLPTFVVIGSMRSGSTSLARYLGAHPQVFVSPTKEVHFFDRHFDRGLDWYEQHFVDAGDALQRGEATPEYFYGEQTMQRLKATLPDARLLVILRNPVDRAYSHYWHDRARGKVAVEFADAIADEPPDPRHDEDGAVRGYLARGRYVRFLEPLAAERADGRVHVVLFEDLRDQGAATYAGLCRFLGVDDTEVPDVVGRPMNEYVEFRSLRVRRAGRGLPRPLRHLLGRTNARKKPYAAMDRDVRARLLEEFAADNAALAQWLDRDLSVWSAYLELSSRVGERRAEAVAARLSFAASGATTRSS